MTAQRDLGPWRNPLYSKLNPLPEGYRPGDVVHRNGIFWQSSVDNNLSMPGVDANWTASSPGELSYGEKVDSVVTTIAGTLGSIGTAVDIPSCTVSVPPTTRPVWLVAEFSVTQTVTGQGLALPLIVETTSGSTLVAFRAVPLPNDTAARNNALTIGVRLRLASSVASTRTFKLQARCDSKATFTPTFTVTNSALAPSFLLAEAK